MARICEKVMFVPCMLQHPLLVVVGNHETNRWWEAFQKNQSVSAEGSECLKVPHLISLPQKRQLVAVDGTFHHMDVVVLYTEI